MGDETLEDPVDAAAVVATADPDASLDAIADRIQAARGDVEDEAAASAEELARLEKDLLVLGRDLAQTEPDLADDRGHPVLADLAAWRRQLGGLDLDESVARADRLVEELVDDQAERWRLAAARTAREGDAEACFDRLMEATELDREALVRRGDAGEAPPLADDRRELRQAFVKDLAREPASPEQLEGWATDLLDRSDVVLIAIDDLEPRTAAAQLDLLADDVAWHLKHVATRKGRGRRRLKRKLSRLKAERQERTLQFRLERIFGAKAVGAWERLIIGLIFLVIGLLFAEAVFDLPEHVVYWMRIADTLACLVFLWDFFFRLALVQDRWRWFRRHALVDLLPSIPFGLLTLSAHGSDPIRAGRAIRLLRLTRLARYVRVLMPVIRLVRAFGFLTRGTDRIVRRYGHLLNRDIILYPTREERERAQAQAEGVGRRFRRLEAEMTDLWEDLLLSAPPEERADVADLRIAGLAEARQNGVAHRETRRVVAAPVTRQVPAEVLVRRLTTTTPEGVEANQGRDFVSRMARAIRVFSRPPLRWIPVLGRYVPRIGVAMTDAEVTAAGARRLGARLRRYLDRWFFFADLYGTVTPAEFVDRVGGTLVKGAFRPAYKLTLFGTAFLLVELVLSITPLDWLHGIANSLRTFVATPLLIFGGIAVAILALGWYLQRVAGEATSFYEQTVMAQFLPLMESIKGRFLKRDARLLDLRVLGPEALLEGRAPREEAVLRRGKFVEGVRAWLLQAQPRGDAKGSFDVMERTMLLYRDGMDGAVLDESDTRTTTQLLGNPALRHLQRSAWCIDKREQKALRALDLAGQRRIGGPYMWFSLVTRAAAHAAARLIVEYNRYAVPLVEMEALTPAGRARYEAWLERRLGREDPDAAAASIARSDYVTMAFTALHFLDDEPHRDHEVEQRFGEPVLRRLQTDRRALFRRIFGTYPLHTRPHEQRVVNLYRVYETWLAGGRALLIPLRVMWGGVKWVGRVVGWVVSALQQIKNPHAREEMTEGAEADFATAVRKIDRMRGPVVHASLWMRARMDCEYLGLRLPGTRETGFDGYGVEHDLEFVDAPASLRRRVEEEHDGAQADLRRLSRLLDDGLLDRVAKRLDVLPSTFGREHMRALAYLYRGDVEGARSLLSAEDVLREVALQAAGEPVPPGAFLPPLRLYLAFRRWWKTHAPARGDRPERKAAWRAVLNDVGGARRALDVWRRFERDAASVEGERRVAALLRHPGRLSGQIVTLRAVQTLALIDVLNYRQHVWQLGRYEEDGEDPGRLVCLGNPEDAVEAGRESISVAP